MRPITLDGRTPLLNSCIESTKSVLGSPARLGMVSPALAPKAPWQVLQGLTSMAALGAAASTIGEMAMAAAHHTDPPKVFRHLLDIFYRPRRDFYAIADQKYSG